MMEAWRKLPMMPLLAAGFLFLLIILWLSSLPVRANFQDLVLAAGYHEDTAGLVTLESAPEQIYQPFKGPLTLGNQSRPLWIQLTLDRSSDADWALVIQPAYTQHVEVWSPDGVGGWQHQVIGSRHAHADRRLNTLTPAVPIRVDLFEPTRLYVKVETATTPVAFRVIRLGDLATFDSLMHLVSGVLTGFALLMMVISYLLYQVTRDRLWLSDVGFNLMGLLMLLFQLGFGSSLLLPRSSDIVDQLTLVTNAVYVMYSMGFFYLIYRLFNLPRWQLVPYAITPVVFIVVMGLISVGHGDLAMRINNLTIFISLFWAFGIIINARHPDAFLLWVFRAGMLAILIYFLWINLSLVLKIQTGNPLTLYPGLPASLFTMLLLMMILGRNTQLQLLESRRIAAEKLAAEQSLAAARQHHEETSSFFGMLLHEIKNPLSAIRLTTANLSRELATASEVIQQRLKRLEQAVVSVDEVLERGVEIDQLVQRSLILSPTDLDVAYWLRTFCENHAARYRLQVDAPDAYQARVDQHLLQLMVANLVDNAVKYAADDTRVICTLSLTRSHWIIAVRNLIGPAGRPDTQRLFSKYYRASNVLTHGGLGLGLYWVRGIARQMGGDVDYLEPNSREVEFRLCLPI